MSRIIVIGSSNTDMVIRSSKLPLPGETIVGGDFYMVGGGKGGNQAVAAVKLGADVSFVAKVGNDLFGRDALRSYSEAGIHVDSILIDEQHPSGIALIMVDEHAENCISVAGGANNALTPKDIDPILDKIRKDDIVLLQMEIPLETNLYAIHKADERGAKVILNPAPATQLGNDVLQKVYLLTPNRIEAELLTGIPVTDRVSGCEALRELVRKGASRVVMTLGSEGVLFIENDRIEFVEARKVTAVDTVGAGDVFNGALSVALSEGKELAEAVRFAVVASSISVTRKGAQTSVPNREEVDALLS